MTENCLLLWTVIIKYKTTTVDSVMLWWYYWVDFYSEFFWTTL